MTRDPRYDILFEPVRIGPVTARNRFYQVPHCNGMGNRHPDGLAAMRGVKAEGGWAVVCTEETEIHPSSDISPFHEGRLWDDRDIPALARVTDAIHAHGGLAGLELAHNGSHAPNLYSRDVPLAPSHALCDMCYPVQARAMDKNDIADVRRWHRQAALRGREAGFDVIYVYAGHDLSLFQHFISRRRNHRTDEYGGSLENRVRLFREVIEDTREAVGDTCAVAVRIAVDELLGDEGISKDGEGREVIEMLAELPDLWDVCLANWSNDSQTARFSQEGFQEEFTSFVKQVTSKPVVGVGRFTSPDAMVSQVKRGVLDFIGAARPSIADPFLPSKIEDGRIDDIRECIGCNICVSSDNTIVPMRCTQNPTKSEEWRKGWHPERIAAKASDAKVLVVGGGPAGLECAHALGKRGYQVALAEAGRELGGRVAHEAALPGLSSWARVRDYRVGQIGKMPNVEVYFDSELDAGQILEFGFEHVALATGSTWRSDGVGRTHLTPVPDLDAVPVHVPDDLFAGRITVEGLPDGDIVIFDDDQYYLGGVLAELIQQSGRQVVLVTPAADVSPFTHNTLEQGRIQRRLMELGVEIRPHRGLAGAADGAVELACTFTDRRETVHCGALLLVTMRLPDDTVYTQLADRHAEWDEAGILSVRRIGDVLAPGTIAAAVYSGHRYAQELDGPASGDAVAFKRELPELEQR
ncbi:MAG: FAD-dependent oxidoreductase [Hyphomicrobiales bacterium]